MDKGPYSQSYGVSSSHIRMWELEHKEGWVPKNLYFRIMVLEKTLESTLDCKEMKQVNPQGTQPWIFIGRTDAEAEAPILWPPDVKSRLIGRPWYCVRRQGRRRSGQQWVRWLAGITDLSLSRLGRQWRTRKPGMLQSMGLQRVGQDSATEQQQGCHVALSATF